MAEWNPIFQGEAAERVRSAAKDLADKLCDEEHGPDDPSRTALVPDNGTLGYGNAGVAVFLAYAGKCTRDAVYHRYSQAYLVRAAAQVSECRSLGLLVGIAGIAWANDHLARMQMAEGAPDSNQEVDTLFRSVLTDRQIELESDVVSGLAGIGVYMLPRSPSIVREECLEHVVDRLARAAKWDARGASWAVRRPNYPADSTMTRKYGLGMAHGTAGVVAFLSQAALHGTADTRTVSLLKAGADWLAQMLEKRRTEREMLREEAPTWCWGMPGIAAALLQAGIALDDEIMKSRAMDVALNEIERTKCGRQFNDSSMCHGTTGTAFVWSWFWQRTRDEAFRRAASDLLSPLVSRGFGNGQSPTLKFAVDAPDGSIKFAPRPGLLVGLSGVGLALLAACESVSPDWANSLLLAVG